MQTIIQLDENTNLQNDLIELNRLEKELAKRKIEVFAKRYLSHYFTVPPAPFHRELFNLFESPQENKRIAIASNRGSGKSVITCTLYPLWAICTKRKKYIVIISESSSLSEQWIAGISKELETNELLIRDFGNLVGEEKWTDSTILTSTGVKIVAKGTGSSTKGLRNFEYRPDLILADDASQDFNSGTTLERQRLEEWWDKSVLQLPGAYPCDIFMIGTIFHQDDLLSTYIKKWNGKKYQLLDENGKSLWPEMFSEEWIRKKREESELAFISEYQNEPVSYLDVKIHKEQLKFYDIEDIVDKPVKLYFGIDPSQSKKNQSDYSSCSCIAKAENDVRIYVVDVFAKRIGYKELMIELLLFVDKCINLFKKAIVEKLVFEDNAFQYIIREEFENLLKERNLYLPTKGIKHTINKSYRFARLCPQLESQTIVFRDTPQQQELIKELITFPYGSYDDRFDSLENAVFCLNQKERNKISIDVLNTNEIPDTDTIDDEDGAVLLNDFKYRPDKYGQLVRRICTGE